jgi:hypothetical protein
MDAGLPEIGDIVLYRSHAGVDYAAVVTALVEADPFAVHLHQLPPPGHAPDPVSAQWGVAVSDDDPPAAGTWRPAPAEDR